jgi:branched-chain amino acid transport system substrate-binding protein
LRRRCSQATSNIAPRAILAGIFALLAATPAAADTRIAFVGALSGAAAAAGRDQRDGFLLAVAERNGRLGGVPVHVSELDDRGDPGRATAIADRLLAEGVRFVTGLTTNESALALQGRLQGKPVLLLSSGAGPIPLAGESCSRNFFSVAPAEDAVHENAGAIAQARRYGKVYLLSPSGPRKAVDAAFRRRYAGQVAPPAEQPGKDPASAIREIRQIQPDAVYLAVPPKEMLSFLQSYEQAGLFHRIPVIAAGVEPELLQRLGPDFSGLIVSVRWAAGLETGRSARFVQAFNARYGRTPSSHAMQAYDAALLLGAALRAAGGISPSVAAVAKALVGHPVQGVAGPVRLGANRFPITDWHAWEVFNESSGSPYLVARERTLERYAGPHVRLCAARSAWGDLSQPGARRERDWFSYRFSEYLSERGLERTCFASLTEVVTAVSNHWPTQPL